MTYRTSFRSDVFVQAINQPSCSKNIRLHPCLQGCQPYYWIQLVFILKLCRIAIFIANVFPIQCQTALQSLFNLFHLFLHDFGSQLAPLPYVASQVHPKPEDPCTLRYAMRTDGSKGFVFVNQYSPNQLAILTSWCWVRRSPCMAFLPPSGGVFRLSSCA